MPISLSGFKVNLLIIGNTCKVIFLSEQDKKITYHLAYSLKSSYKLLHLSGDNGVRTEEYSCRKHLI